MAEGLLREALASRGADQVTVSSAGTGAWDGAPVSEGGYLVGLEHGLDLSGHRARLLTRDLVKSADLILTMSPQHRARVAELGGEDKVRVLGEYVGRDEASAEVSDPVRLRSDELPADIRRAAGADRAGGQPAGRHRAVIGGGSRVLAILGDPVAHSLSPTMQNAAFRALGLSAVYVPLRCSPRIWHRCSAPSHAPAVGGT